MTITKLGLVASLLAVVGLTARGAVRLAAQTTEGKAAAPPVALTADIPLLPSPATEAHAGPSKESAIPREPEHAAQPDPDVPDDLPPVVVNIEPKVDATNVDPGLGEIRVTFSKKMTDKSWSWPSGNVYATPKSNGTVHYEKDMRTCVMPVKLEPGKTYVLGINSERFRGFKDVSGHPALPYLVVFHTKAAN